MVQTVLLAVSYFAMIYNDGGNKTDLIFLVGTVP